MCCGILVRVEMPFIGFPIYAKDASSTLNERKIQSA